MSASVRKFTLLLCAFSLLFSCSDDSESTDPTPQPTEPGYTIGTIQGGSFEDAVAARWALEEWSGQSDGPIFVAGATVDALTTEQQDALGEASLAGQIITLVNANEAQLDAFVEHLDIERTHDIATRVDGTPWSVSGIFAFDGQTNGEDHFHAPNMESEIPNTTGTLVDGFADWVTTESTREERPLLGDDGIVNLVDSAKSYAGSKTIITDDNLWKVTVSSFIVSAYSVMGEAWLVMVRSQINVEPVDADNRPPLTAVTIIGSFFNGTTELNGVTWLSSEPMQTPEPATSITSGINWSVSGTIGFSEGTNDSVMESETIGATWVDQDTITVENMTVSNQGSASNGFTSIELGWMDPPDELTVQTPQHALFEIPQSVLSGDRSKLRFAFNIEVERADSDNKEPVGWSVPVVLPDVITQ